MTKYLLNNLNVLHTMVKMNMTASEVSESTGIPVGRINGFVNGSVQPTFDETCQMIYLFQIPFYLMVKEAEDA